MLERVFKLAKFSDLAQPEDTKALIPPAHDEEAAQPQSPSRHVLPGLYVSLLWVLSIAIALLAGAWQGSHRLGNIDQLCIKHVSQYCTKTYLRVHVQLLTRNSTYYRGYRYFVQCGPVQWAFNA
jgi:hypothetical protein